MAPIVLLLSCYRRAARVALVVTVVQSLLFAFTWMPVMLAANLPFWLAAGCALVGFHGEAVLPRAAPWWGVLGRRWCGWCCLGRSLPRRGRSSGWCWPATRPG